MWGHDDSRYFSSGFYHGGLQFSSVSFFAENIKIGRFYLVLFPFLFMLRNEGGLASWYVLVYFGLNGPSLFG